MLRIKGGKGALQIEKFFAPSLLETIVNCYITLQHSTTDIIVLLELEKWQKEIYTC